MNAVLSNQKNLKVYKDIKAEKAANCHNGCAAMLQTFTLHYCEGQTTLLLSISCWKESTLASLRGGYATTTHCINAITSTLTDLKSRITLSTDRIFFFVKSMICFNDRLFLCKYPLLAAGETPHTREVCRC